MYSHERLQQRLGRDREAIEKARLRERTGAYHRYEDPGPLTAVDPSCPSSLDPREAFIATEDVARLEHLDRQYQQALREELNERRRAEQVSRDSERWGSVEKKIVLDNQKVQRMQQDAIIGKKNHSGHPFNIVTLEYQNNREGARLAYHDQLQKYRGELRSTYLAVHGHLGFNPITGEQTIPLNIPPKPERPPLDSKNADFSKWTNQTL